MDITAISRYISLILRHHPEVIGITVAYEGAWADTAALLSGVQRRYPQLDMALLEYIVATDKKQRYSFSADKPASAPIRGIPSRLTWDSRRRFRRSFSTTARQRTPRLPFSGKACGA